MSSETPNEGGHKKPPIPTPAKKIVALNIEKRGDRLYEADKLHKWFAISSLLLFVFTIAMVVADYTREWKRYQRDFVRLQIQRTRQDAARANEQIDRNRYNETGQQLQQARAQEQQNEGEIERLQGEVKDLSARIFAVDQNYRFSKAIYDAERYEYEEALANKASNVNSLNEKLLETEQEMNEYKAELDKLTLERRGKNDELDKYIGERNKLQKERENLRAEFDRVRSRLGTLNPGAVVVSFRNAPVFDFMNPSERVNQILLSNLYNDQPFKMIPRVDRCTTCHLGIDQPAYQDAPQPFRTHPNLELYLSASSKHPMESFGCTSCHGGVDRATSFQNAAHSPRDEKQLHEWEEKYGWHHNHYFEYQLPMQNIEGGCYKCHNASPEVPRANTLNAGRDLIRIYGCFGCHKIPGYENVRKVGPDLSTISGKLTKDWVKKWLANPKEFKSEARMPQFWWNSNNSGNSNGVDWDKRNAAEINAITEFLWANSKPQQLPASRNGGNIEAGKQIVESVGCFGCHAVGPIKEVATQSQIRRRHGYNLASQGSKVTQSWLYNWVKDPSQVWPNTKMPSLRLTDQEATDVAAYIASLKNPEFDKKPVPPADPAALDSVALELLRNNSTDIEAREKLKGMTVDQKNLYVGEGLIARYGCFACHDIPKFEKAQPIGTELTTAGSKLLAQFDFGFLKGPDGRPIEHSKHEWYKQKLHDPRVFDIGRVKRPEELLRMPNFHFSDNDVEAITGVLLSMVKDPVPLEMRDRTTQAVAEGRQLISEKNCRGCHIIEGAGGDIRPTREAAQWPPNLNTQGAKTQPLWLHPFLKDPSMVKLRPWMTTRMPTFHFTEREAATIEKYFSELDKVPYPFIDTAIETDAETLKVGAELFAKLQCQSCHPTSNTIPPGKTAEDLAPNLQLSADRLRPEWVLDWIADPQRIFPGTRMPAFFAAGQPNPFKDILGGDSQKQIKALRDHLFLTVGNGRRATRGTGAAR